jgi:hypothetical protein
VFKKLIKNVWSHFKSTNNITITMHNQIIYLFLQLCQPPSFFQRLSEKLQKLEAFFDREFENVTDTAVWAGVTDGLTCDLKSKLRLHSTPTDDLIMDYHLARYCK